MRAPQGFLVVAASDKYMKGTLPCTSRGSTARERRGSEVEDTHVPPQRTRDTENRQLNNGANGRTKKWGGGGAGRGRARGIASQCQHVWGDPKLVQQQLAEDTCGSALKRDSPDFLVLDNHVGSWEGSRGAVPAPLQDAVPVGRREDVLLDEVVDHPAQTVVHALVPRHVLHKLQLIAKLHQQQAANTCHERARGVAIVMGIQRLPSAVLHQVVHQDWRLPANRGGRLRGGHGRAVPHGKDVGVLLVLQGGVVDINEAVLVGYRGTLQEFWRGHRRGNVQQVERQLLVRALGGGEGGDLPQPIHRDEVVAVQAVQPALRANLLNGVVVLLYGEHRGARGGVRNVDVRGDALRVPVVPAHEHRLHRRSSALQWGAEREQRGATGQGLHKLPRVHPSAVVAAHPVLAQGLLQPGDLVPVQLDSRGDNEVVILELPAILSYHRVDLGAHLFGIDRLPLGPLGDEVLGVLHSGGKVKDARSHEGPARLVVMVLGLVQDGDFK
eukprot:RCo023108